MKRLHYAETAFADIDGGSGKKLKLNWKGILQGIELAFDPVETNTFNWGEKLNAKYVKDINKYTHYDFDPGFTFSYAPADWNGHPENAVYEALILMGKNNKYDILSGKYAKLLGQMHENKSKNLIFIPLKNIMIFTKDVELEYTEYADSIKQSLQADIDKYNSKYAHELVQGLSEEDYIQGFIDELDEKYGYIMSTYVLGYWYITKCLYVE